MRLLLYVLTAWVVLSIPVALFFGRCVAYRKIRSTLLLARRRLRRTTA